MGSSGLTVIAEFDNYNIASVAAARLRAAGIAAVLPNQPGGVRGGHWMMPSVTRDNNGYVVELLVSDEDAAVAIELLDGEAMLPAEFRDETLAEWSDQIDDGESRTAHHVHRVGRALSIVMWFVFGVVFVLVVMIVLSARA